MFQDERHEQIMKELTHNQSVKIIDLCKKFDVTRETIRRDLQEMENRGLLKRVHGGAILSRTNVEPTYSKRSQINLKEKEVIAQRAAEHVEDGDSLYLDIGTTTQLMPKYLQGKKNLTVITNGLLTAFELSKLPNIKVILSGGELRSGELSLSGPISINSLEALYIDKAFIGIGGITAQSGITDFHIDESQIRKTMIENASEVFALGDFSKFGVRAFTKVCDFKDITVLITDNKAPRDILSELEKFKLQIEVL
ncbi:DeoR family transcriptional regulator [Bacillus oleivorans]|uniref:DeoR family transcriptional regulator n=1 Tax=Bacillus oleivorans TaxID=1448271 RepID=A0A285CPF7_9BACI|nr:DeoR/GlpR family DNA-binding transcription regulator [Bacillus oleivorans]SNX69470.1 DeoR family transcriptional regulator [Bacillus oleivorans]